jgi:hypothetical protein
MHTGSLGAAEETAKVLRVLERVEHQQERRFAALAGVGENRVDVGRRAWPGDEGNALVAIEARQRGQRPTFYLDHGNA